jgi:hypothetical protein
MRMNVTDRPRLKYVPICVGYTIIVLAQPATLVTYIEHCIWDLYFWTT